MMENGGKGNGRVHSLSVQAVAGFFSHSSYICSMLSWGETTPPFTKNLVPEGVFGIISLPPSLPLSLATPSPLNARR